MAFGASNLHLSPVAPGSNVYWYRTSDTMAAVLDINGDGYFDNGPDAAPKLAVDDLVYAICTDGKMWLKVSAVGATTGIVTVQYYGGNLPIRTWATGTAAGDFGMSPGFYEVGTTVSTSSRGVMPVPYPGAELKVQKIDSGTQGHEFDAGASASNISWVDGTVGGGTGVTLDGTNRRITLRMEGENFHVVGSSTSRWRLMGLSLQSTGDGCGSVIPQEGASNSLSGT